MHFRNIVALFALAMPALAYSRGQTFYARDLSDTDVGTITARDLAFAFLDELEARATGGIQSELEARDAKSDAARVEFLDKEIGILERQINNWKAKIAKNPSLASNWEYLSLVSKLPSMVEERRKLRAALAAAKTKGQNGSSKKTGANTLKAQVAMSAKL
ncbi:hypothetical protein Hypma_003511 [Hypsizygus marmoreus]|uniref:Uncharacterized protein n=1 Tax=Hypsizygus marmoreus TaxID=39966 RepID=A0A369J5Y2_HYPMA|nr:hypothetical protein Hypma_003511 [Hypsizygus marmoreus]